MSVSHPLEGVIVVEAADDIALGFCGKYLAELGASVTIAESQRFDGEREALGAYLDGAKHVGPIGSSHGSAADVVLTRDPEAHVSAQGIRVVVTDNGEAGPHAHRVGGDLLAQASSGLMSLVGDADGPPLQIGGHQMDYAAGLMAFTGTMIALTARDRDAQRRGQDVCISRLEAGSYIEWKGRAYSQSGLELVRGDASGPVVVRTRDGYFGLYYRQSDWARILEVFDSEQLRTAPFDTADGRAAHRSDLADLLAELAADWTSSELYRRLQAAGVPAGPVYSPHELGDSAQIQHQRLLRRVGSGSAPALPMTMNGLRPGQEDEA